MDGGILMFNKLLVK